MTSISWRYACASQRSDHCSPGNRELDINPLLVDENGVIAIDARLKLADQQTSPRPELSIRPYPAYLEKVSSSMASGRSHCVRFAPKTNQLRIVLAAVSPDDIRLRFFTRRRTFPHAFLAQLTQIDYARENGVRRANGGHGRTAGRIAARSGSRQDERRIQYSRQI